MKTKSVFRPQWSLVLLFSLLNISCGGGGGGGSGADPGVGAAGGAETVIVAPEGVWITNGGTSLLAQNSSLARVDPTSNTVSARLPEEGAPGANANAVKVAPQTVVFCAGSVWVAGKVDDVVQRINPHTNQIVDTVTGMPSDASLTCVDDVELWSTSKSSRSLWVYQIADGTKTDINSANQISNAPRSTVSTSYGVWVLDISDQVVQVDKLSKSKTGTLSIGSSGKAYWPLGVTGSGDYLWVIGQNTSTNKLGLVRLNIKDKAVGPAKPDTEIPGFSETAWAFGVDQQILVLNGQAWIPARTLNKVFRLDATTGAVIDSISVGAGPRGIASGFGSVWVTNATDNSLSRIDPATATVIKTFEVGALPTQIAISRE